MSKSPNRSSNTGNNTGPCGKKNRNARHAKSSWSGPQCHYLKVQFRNSRRLGLRTKNIPALGLDRRYRAGRLYTSAGTAIVDRSQMSVAGLLLIISRREIGQIEQIKAPPRLGRVPERNR